MNSYDFQLESPLICYYVRAQNFPADAKASHVALHAQVSYSNERQYFGFSKFKKDGSLEYLAACTELFDGELSNTRLERIVIPSGLYLCTELENYMEQIDKIGVLFAELVKDTRFDAEAWAIEWYKQQVCVCMVPLKS